MNFLRAVGRGFAESAPIHSWPVSIAFALGCGCIGSAVLILASSPARNEVLAAGCAILLGAVILLAAWELAQ